MDDIQSKLQQIVKIGPKGRHMKVPYGYKIVTSGICEDGDMFANGLTYTWSSVEHDDINMPCDSFECLIRKMAFDERLAQLRTAMKALAHDNIPP